MTTEDADGGIVSISAVTLATQSMPKSVEFYKSLGFELRSGGPMPSSRRSESAASTSTSSPLPRNRVGGDGVIFWVGDVDRMHRRALDAGWSPEAPPRDADWGERYFHLSDPDGHELSFARGLAE